MIRETSIEAYHKIKENGLLGRLSFEIYKCIVENGPITIRETSSLFPSINDRSVSPRFSELEKKGVIKITNKRQCKISGKIVYEWDSTGKLPVKFEKPTRMTCKHCHGKGYIEEQQVRFDL